MINVFNLIIGTDIFLIGIPVFAFMQESEFIAIQAIDFSSYLLIRFIDNDFIFLFDYILTLVMISNFRIEGLLARNRSN